MIDEKRAPLILATEFLIFFLLAGGGYGPFGNGSNFGYATAEQMSTISIECMQVSNNASLFDLSQYNRSHVYLIRINNKNYSHITENGLKTANYTVKTLELSYNQIRSIEVDAFKDTVNLQRLYLSNNAIKKLDFLECECMSQLVILRLTDNLIRELNPTLFRHLGKLNTLYLDTNYLSKVTPVLFQDLVSLVTMDLSNNNIEIICNLSFTGLKRLVTLNVQRNSLKLLTQHGFYDLDSLSKLVNLHDQGIEVIEPHAFSALPNTTELMLSNNALSSLVDFTFSGMRSLDILSLGFNKIRLISEDAFAGLNNLTKLFLNENNIELLQYAIIMRLPRLQQLSLTSNKILEIEVDPLSGLNGVITYLNLGINRLDSFRDNHFANFSHLVHLVASTNQISKIAPTALRDTRALEILDLADNCLFELDPRTFNSLTTLKTLVLSNNLLRRLHPELTNALVSLTTLDLSNNRLTYVDPQWLSELTKLTTLKLANNLIASLASDSFRTLLALKSLDLSANSIGSLNSSLTALRSLENLNVAANPLTSLAGEIVRYRQVNKYLNCSNTSLALVRSVDFGAFAPLYSLDVSYVDLSTYAPSSAASSTAWNSISRVYLKKTGVKRLSSLSPTLAYKEAIDLSENNPVSGDELAKASRVVELRLSNTGLVALDEHFNLSALHSLKHLDISRNRLQSILADHFRSNYRLEHLNVSHNRLHFIANASFATLFELKTLDLSGNRLATFTYHVYGNAPTVLQTLLFNHNKLTVWQASSGQVVPTFGVVDLSANELPDMPVDVVRLGEKLTQLDLSHNMLTRVRNNSFRYMFDLGYLTFAANRIENVERGAFAKLKNLYWLDLSGNELDDVDESTFAGQLTLAFLNLSRNRIERLRAGLFANLKSLISLDLDHNRIRRVDEGALANLAFLENVYMNAAEMAVTARTFAGLGAVKNVGVAARLLRNEATVGHLTTSLRPGFLGRCVNYACFYHSIHVSTDRRWKDAASECALTIRFLRFKIHLNLRTDLDVENFLAMCADLVQFSRFDLL